MHARFHMRAPVPLQITFPDWRSMPTLELVPLDSIGPTPYYIKRGAPRRCLSNSSCPALLSNPRIEIPDPPPAGSRCSFFVGRWRLMQRRRARALVNGRCIEKRITLYDSRLACASYCVPSLPQCAAVTAEAGAPAKTRVNLKKEISRPWLHIEYMRKYPSMCSIRKRKVSDHHKHCNSELQAIAASRQSLAPLPLKRVESHLGGPLSMQISLAAFKRFKRPPAGARVDNIF